MGWGGIRGGDRGGGGVGVLKFYYFVRTNMFVCLFFVVVFLLLFFLFVCVCVCVCVSGPFSRFFLGLISKTDYLGLTESSVYFYTQGINEYIKYTSL